MEKVYSIENLDCANCAAKAEAKIRKIPGIEAASITFATMQLRLTADDPDALLPLALRAAREIEPDIQFLPYEKEHHDNHCHDSHHDGCTCDHNRHHHHEKSELPGIILGAGLFAAALAASLLLPKLFLHIPLFIGIILCFVSLSLVALGLLLGLLMGYDYFIEENKDRND